MNKPEKMADSTFASLVRGVDVLFSEGYPESAKAVKSLLSEHCVKLEAYDRLRETSVYLRNLRDELIAERDDLERQLDVKTNEARGLADQLDEAKRDCQQLEGRCREYEQDMGAMGKELMEARAPGPSALTNRTDQATLNELAFTSSTGYLREKLIHMAEDHEHLTPVQSALVAAAGDRLGVDTWPSQRQLERRPVTKGELAAALYPEEEGFTVDCAIPLHWLDKVWSLFDEDNRQRIEKHGGLAAQFVTVYHTKEPAGYVMPVTRCGIEILAVVTHGVQV